MRLLASRQFNYKLSDHSLVDLATERQVLTNPNSEKDVFRILKMKWKEPEERDCFDAVESVDPTNNLTAQLSEGFSVRDLKQEEGHAWVH
jgi:DNA polymerase beta thumb